MNFRVIGGLCFHHVLVAVKSRDQLGKPTNRLFFPSKNKTAHFHGVKKTKPRPLFREARSSLDQNPEKLRQAVFFNLFKMLPALDPLRLSFLRTTRPCVPLVLPFRFTACVLLKRDFHHAGNASVMSQKTS